MFTLFTTAAIALAMTVSIVPHDKKASPDDVAKYEKLIGTKLPEAYRAFLLRSNGGHPDFSVDRNIHFPIQWNGQPFADQYEGAFLESFDTLDDSSMTSLFRTFDYTRGTSKIIPADTITIAVASGGAVLLGVGAHNRGKVYFWAQDQMPVQDDYVPDYNNVGLVAPDFESFLALLKPWNEVAPGKNP